MGKSSRKKQSRQGSPGLESGPDGRAEPTGGPLTEGAGSGAGRDGPGLGIILAAPALLALAAHVFTLGNELVHDDPGLFRYLSRLGGPGELFVQMPRGEPNPVLTYLTVYLERLIWGEWIPGFRITNLILHAACTSLAGLAALILSGRRWVGLLTGLFFAAHPVHVEAVASIENRKDLLAMVFAASSLILYRLPWRAIPKYLAVSACVVAAVLSKAVATVGLVILLPASTVLVPVAGRQGESLRLRRILPTAIVAGAICVGIATTFLGSLPSFFTPKSIYMQTEGLCRSYSEVLVHSAGGVAEALRLLILPAHLNGDYEGPSARRTRVERAGWGTVIVAATVIAFAVTVRFAPVAAFALLWMVVTYIPTSNVLPIGHFFVADRYLYLPSFGLCLIVALLLDALARAQYGGRSCQIWAAAIACVIVAGGTARSVVRTLDWRDSVTFWSANVKSVPQASARANFSLGLALVRTNRPAEAIPYLETAVAMLPHFPPYRRVLQRARERAQQSPASDE